MAKIYTDGVRMVVKVVILVMTVGIADGCGVATVKVVEQRQTTENKRQDICDFICDILIINFLESFFFGGGGKQ